MLSLSVLEKVDPAWLKQGEGFDQKWWLGWLVEKSPVLDQGFLQYEGSGAGSDSGNRNGLSSPYLEISHASDFQYCCVSSVPIYSTRRSQIHFDTVYAF